ncbi:hypothetical protein CKO31_24655 [Thiohalocapsa halophila]|uniref:PBP domain-containing protein n=1 Tax=Thiohalocapsa halophila TaxID=69359 RepID=A0ABS1CPW0_9GAMM|nr:hypothetical protein [Thiohalocapsa halophila]
MNPATRPMARLCHLLVTAALLGLMASAQAQDNAQEPVKLIGTGASFPVPLYLRWFRDYHLAHPHIRVDYQSIGSAGGVKDLIAGRVDFAGTDLRLTPEEAAEVHALPERVEQGVRGGRGYHDDAGLARPAQAARGPHPRPRQRRCCRQCAGHPRQHRLCAVRIRAAAGYQHRGAR